MSNIVSLPERSAVKLEDTWDLTYLFETDEAWNETFQKVESQIERYASFQGRLGDGADVLADCLQFDSDLERTCDRLANYAYLKTTEDQTNSDYQAIWGRYRNIATKAGEAASFIRPEILAIDDERMKSFLGEDCMQKFKLVVERIIRYKPYTLSNQEEQIIAMQGEMAGASGNVFRKLNDADLKFGVVENEKGEQVELSHATFSQFMESSDREVRRTAFEQYYQGFSAHENTLAATLEGSIQKDVYYARVRGYQGALSQALFSDDVPRAVYDNLITAVRDNLPTLHRYYDLRRRKMGLEQIHQYDTYVPILSEIEMKHTWDEAVEVVINSLSPLGEDYCKVLRQGLAGRWCDR
ncbi:MAG: M3 family metallopeptidase, partial [Planctomycetota bacterium]|nr:M3 family metallopeptidase [Planctomycetota bacterium]